MQRLSSTGKWLIGLAVAMVGVAAGLVARAAPAAEGAGWHRGFFAAATAAAVLAVSLTWGLLVIEQRRPRPPTLSAEDRDALGYRLLLARAAERGKPLRRRAAKRWLRAEFRRLEQRWAEAPVDVADCVRVVQRQALWTPEVSKVETGVMLTLQCSNTGLLTNIACRVEDQHGMKHQSERTGPLARIEVRFKYPTDFDTAPAFPREGWHQAAWFHPNDDPETGAIDVGLGREIVTCRFRVVQSNQAVSASVQS